MAEPTEPDGDPRDPSVLGDQQRAYDEMRSRCPVAHSDFLGWSLFAHRDVVAAARDTGTFSSATKRRAIPNGMDPTPSTPPIDIPAVTEVWRRGSVVASPGCSTCRAGVRPERRPVGLRGSRLRLRRGPLDEHRRHRRRPPRRPSSPPRCTSASRHAASRTSPTRCCRPCASASAATTKEGLGATGPAVATRDRSDAFVFFGATGDLAFKQIFPALLGLIRDEDFDLPIIGVARSGDLDALRERARQSLGGYGCHRRRGDQRAHRRACATSRARTTTSRRSMRLRRELGDARHPLHYLAIPPGLFGEVIANLEASGCAEGARVILEKPFGRDLASAMALNETIHAGLRRAGHLPHRPLPRQGAGPEPALLPIRQLVPRAALEPQPRRQCPDHHGRGVRRRRARGVLRPGGRDPRRRSRTTSSRS